MNRKARKGRITIKALYQFLLNVKQTLKKMGAQLDALQAAVAKNTSAENSAIELIKGLAQQIKDLQPDQAAIDALAAEVNAKADALAAAVTENTTA